MTVLTIEATMPTFDMMKEQPPRPPTATDCSSSDSGSDNEATPVQTAPTVQAAPAPTHKSLSAMIEPRFWSIVTICGIAVTAPFVIPCTLFLVLVHRLLWPVKPVPFNGKVAIVSGGKMTKSFIMIKQLKAQGCRVVLVETSKYWMVASRFSNCVDRFVTVPIPEKEPEAYLQAVKALAEEEKADLFVPVTSPVASAYEARLHSVLPAHCFCWSLSSADVELLDDKVIFCQMAEQIGLSVPTSHRVSSGDEVRTFNEKLRTHEAAGAKPKRFILKNLAYDSMHRLDLFTLPCAPARLEDYLAGLAAEGTLNAANPWTLQTFITGEEHCAGGIFKDGKLLAFADNEASISCFNYTPARLPQLRHWVETFVAARKLSGIACFDFIIEADGTPYAIECNPRCSSNIAAFYDNPALGAVLCEPAAFSGTVEPLPSAVETYWLFAEAWAAITKPGRVAAAPARALALARALLTKKDAYFSYEDPLPFLALHYVHLPTLLLRNLVTGNRWAKIDPCIGKLTEENGD